MLTGTAGIKETLFSGDLNVEGSRLDLVSFFRLFDKPDGTFNIVVP
jgi:alkyl sulfatase BDS1-like metallo-beta-lactamase superfamily hydrolase